MKRSDAEGLTAPADLDGPAAASVAGSRPSEKTQGGDDGAGHCGDGGLSGKTAARRRRLAAAALLIVAFCAQSILIARGNSLCNDEGKHLVTGWWLLKHRQACLGVDNSPLTALFALPILFDNLKLPPDIRMGSNAHQAGYRLIFGSRNPEWVVFRARLTTVALGAVMLWLVWRVARGWFGEWGGLLALGLLAFDPNLTAHFSLISTDALFSFATVLVLFCMDRFFTRPTYARAGFLGLALGLGVIAKFTGLVLWPLTVLCAPLYRRSVRRKSSRFWMESALIATACGVLVVWVGYGAYLRASPPFLAFPGFLPGFDQAARYATHGMPSFFCGETGTWWPTYFIIVLLLKTPLPLLFAWTLAVLAVTLGRKRYIQRPWVLAPLVFAGVFYVISLRSHLNIGMRHILQGYPMMALFSGVLVDPAARGVAARCVRWCAAALVAWLAAVAAAILPLNLSYFNELAGGPTGGIRYLGDSNVDWGQDLKRLRRELERRNVKEIICAYMGNTDPAFYGIRYQYLPAMFFSSAPLDFVVGGGREIIAVSVNNLQGTLYAIPGLPDPLAWLRSRKPAGRAGYSIYLYDITGDAAAHRRLADFYRRCGLAALAEKEEAKAAAYGARSTAGKTAVRSP